MPAILDESLVIGGPPVWTSQASRRARIVSTTFVLAFVAAAVGWQVAPPSQHWFPILSDAKAAISKEEVSVWWCNDLMDKKVASAEEYCCGVSLFVHHCAVLLRFEEASETALVEWDGGLSCKSYSKAEPFASSQDAQTGVRVSCGYQAFWPSQPRRPAGSSMMLRDVQQRGRERTYRNCQYFATDIYNNITGSRTDLDQGFLAQLAGGISASSKLSSSSIASSIRSGSSGVGDGGIGSNAPEDGSEKMF